ncbi:uncharacterized protein LOC124435392 [Xenia sp. Carnegie-2017]|uniref:uncharacterized protein LOC124435392 n=1 Tax=Xenia sp. Carnegie-2017 TaxID=2897299 RepID=UPI001F04D0AC|nr:uncharacterized protein LOC124435392 [Xenia sp. Carnegie-2017]
MEFKLNHDRIPFDDWMLNDVTKEIENAINDAAISQNADDDRVIRRSVASTRDYSDCSVRVAKHQVFGDKLSLKIVFVCARAPRQSYVCDAMFKSRLVTSCVDETGQRWPRPTSKPTTINPVRINFAFVVRNVDDGYVSASAIVENWQVDRIEDELNKYSMNDVTVRARVDLVHGRRKDSLSPSAITGVSLAVVAIITVSVVAVFLIVRSRKFTQKQFRMARRAFLSRSQSADVIISREINLRELENAETREMRNKSISEMFETNDVSTMSPKDGLFMIRNEGLVSKRHHQSSITKLDSFDWFHGNISRAKAEDLLEASDTEGIFLVRAGFDDSELYISVYMPDAEPKFRHITVKQQEDSFVMVCNSDTRNFTTFQELIKHLRENPTKMDGFDDFITLKDHIDKLL